jgi:hypothetical protein
MWSAEVEEPFRSDARFWRSVTTSLFALLALLLAAVVTGIAGRWGAVAFALPVVPVAPQRATLARGARRPGN